MHYCIRQVRINSKNSAPIMGSARTAWLLFRSCLTTEFPSHPAKRRLHISATRLKAQILDGKKLSKEILSEIKCDIDLWIKAGYNKPHLSVVLVGNNPASLAYINNKVKAAQKVGITSSTFRLPDKISQAYLISLVESLNNDRNTDGILVQFPLPAHLSEQAVCEAVSPDKDVDGFHVLNMGHMVQGREGMYPCTPLGVMELLKRSGVKTFGKNAVVIGRSKNVGMPIMMLMHADGHGDATTTICHRHTPPEQMRLFTKMADILITAVGRPGLITADMVKEGVVVVDVGITRVWDSQADKFVLRGDVDFEGVSEKASYITPVPGGVGPMTVCMLIKNTFAAARKLRGYDASLDFAASNELNELNLEFAENLREVNVKAATN